MALKNEFNHRGDGDRDGSRPDPVVRLDAALTVVADRWAERWQARGGGSRQALTQGLYALAAGAAGVYVLLTGEWLFLGLGALAYAGGARGKQRGALIDEIQLEAVGLPRHTLKYLSVFLLGLGLFGLLSGLAAAVLDALLLGTPAARRAPSRESPPSPPSPQSRRRAAGPRASLASPPPARRWLATLRVRSPPSIWTDVRFVKSLVTRARRGDGAHDRRRCGPGPSRPVRYADGPAGSWMLATAQARRGQAQGSGCSGSPSWREGLVRAM